MKTKKPKNAPSPAGLFVVPQPDETVSPPADFLAVAAEILARLNNNQSLQDKAA